MRCENCGKIASRRAKFCPECGTQVQWESRSRSASPVSSRSLRVFRLSTPLIGFAGSAGNLTVSAGGTGVSPESLRGWVGGKREFDDNRKTLLVASRPLTSIHVKEKTDAAGT